MVFSKVKDERRKVKGLTFATLGTCILLLGAVGAKAQTFSEWFAQKSTQKKYLLLQIEALQQYGSYIRQGYQISQHGLSSIGAWMKSEFELHGAHYSSLRTVDPNIKNNPKANDCINYALGITKLLSSLSVISDDAVS